MQFHMGPSVGCFYGYLTLKMQTGMQEKYDKKLPSEQVLERKRFRFFDCTFLLQ